MFGKRFVYDKEVWSFYSRVFISLSVGLFVVLVAASMISSDIVSRIFVFGLYFWGNLYVYRRTNQITKRYNYFKENGVKCTGHIVDVQKERQYTRNGNQERKIVRYTYLVVKYQNPFTNEIEEVITEGVNHNPYEYLSSREVTVYVMEDGSTLVTDFKEAKKKSECIFCQEHEM